MFQFSVTKPRILGSDAHSARWCVVRLKVSSMGCASKNRCCIVCWSVTVPREMLERLKMDDVLVDGRERIPLFRSRFCPAGGYRTSCSVLVLNSSVRETGTNYLSFSQKTGASLRRGEGLG